MPFLNPHALVSIKDVARFIYADATTLIQSEQIAHWINSASERCEQYVGRRLSAELLTEYQDGPGDSRLFLNSWPIQAVITLHDDTDRTWGSDTEITATGNVLVYEDTGMIRLWNDETIFTRGKQNIRIIYRAGYDLLDVVASENDRLDFKAGTSTTLTATFAVNRYESIESLAGHISTRMNSIATPALTVKYNRQDERFTIANSDSTTLELLWLSGSNAARSIAAKLGFDYRSDDTGASSYKADWKFFLLPGDLRQSIIEQVAWWRKQSKIGDGAFGQTSKSVEGVAVTNALADTDILPSVKQVWKMYRRIRF